MHSDPLSSSPDFARGTDELALTDTALLLSPPLSLVARAAGKLLRHAPLGIQHLLPLLLPRLDRRVPKGNLELGGFLEHAGEVGESRGGDRRLVKCLFEDVCATSPIPSASAPGERKHGKERRDAPIPVFTAPWYHSPPYSAIHPQ